MPAESPPATIRPLKASSASLTLHRFVYGFAICQHDLGALDPDENPASRMARLQLVGSMKPCYRSDVNNVDECSFQPPHVEPGAPQRQPRCGSLPDLPVLMAGQRTKLREDARFRLLRLLQENPELSQRDLAKAVGSSVGGIHYILNALIDTGLVKLENFTAAADKRRYAYILTPKGLAEKATITKRFLARKLEEYDAIKAEIEALSAEAAQDARPGHTD
jgi:EPS-associated MarR family transcriptional regulator